MALPEYYIYASKSNLDKAVNSLLGIIEGISIDSIINPTEYDFLLGWVSEYSQYKDKHPFCEFIPKVEIAINDKILTTDERDDILWLCEKLISHEYYDQYTSDIQVLHALLGGIACDGEISKADLDGLCIWLEQHSNLKECWPYTEVESIIVEILKDGVIEPKEHNLLQHFFSQFVSINDIKTVTQPPILIDNSLKGICAVNPTIKFNNSIFCFTGESKNHSRVELEAIVIRNGGSLSNSITKKLNYLIVGSDGNTCWAYACYGRKVEKAIEYRKAGHNILIVHELDFFDALADQ